LSERAPEAATVHRTKHLDVAYRVEPEALGDPVPHDREQLPDTLLCLRRIDEEEIACLGNGEIRHLTVVDAVRVGDASSHAMAAKNRSSGDFKTSSLASNLTPGEICKKLDVDS
jgi:hypothetical protein